MKVHTLSKTVMNYPAAQRPPKPPRRARPSESIFKAPARMGYGRPAQSRAGQS